MWPWRGISLSTIRVLMPSRPHSPRNTPVRSGPYQRKNGLVPAAAAEPVVSTWPSAVTTCRPSTTSAEQP